MRAALESKVKRGSEKLLARFRSPSPRPRSEYGTVSTPIGHDHDQPVRPVSAGEGTRQPLSTTSLPAQDPITPPIRRVSGEGPEISAVAPTCRNLSLPQLVVPAPGVVPIPPVVTPSCAASQAPAPTPTSDATIRGPEPNVPRSAPTLPPVAQPPPSGALASGSTPSIPIVTPAAGQITPQSQANVATPPSPTPSLWKQAYDKLSAKDKLAFPYTDTDRRNYIEDILEATKQSRDTCQERALKFTFMGKDIIVRDVADKLVAWAEKFKAVGDCVVQYDPAHAALPWAGVRFLLQVAVNNKETMEVVVVGVERVVRLLVRCAAYEGLYLGSNSRLAVRKSLEDALEGLYCAVLEFLAFAKRYLEKSSAGKVFHGLFDVEGGSHYNSLEQWESNLVKIAGVAEAEMRKHDHEMSGERSEELKAILNEMEGPIKRIDLNVGLMYDELQSHIEGAKRSKVLQWISQVGYEKHHETAKQGLLENTGQWLLDKAQFREWQSSSSSSILWLHGIPGAGKTKLTCRVIDILESTLQKHEPVVYFYCNRNEPQRRDPTTIMQAIVKQLSVVFPDLPKSVVAIYDKRERRGLAAGVLGFQESCDLVISLLKIYAQTTIIIDALDESNPEDRWQLLEAFGTILHSSNLVKIFVSSRDDADIKLHLGLVPNHYIKASDNAGDIERFVWREVTTAICKKRLLRGEIAEELKDLIISTIVQGAEGMFQWADLQIKHLYNMKFERDIRSSLGRLPKTLEATYAQIFDDMSADTPFAQQITKKALMWVMCTEGKLTLHLWAEATYWPEEVPKGGVAALFELCRNLVRWDQYPDNVTFGHLSVREYLENKVFSFVEANSMAAESCLSFFINPDNWIPAVRQINTSPEYHWFSAVGFAEYSTTYWGDHVVNCSSQGMSMPVLEKLQYFLGTSDVPGIGYCRWLQTADKTLKSLEAGFFYSSKTSPVGRKLEEVLRHLRSIPPCPFFAMCYFGFGEELKDQWTYNTFDIHQINREGETYLLVAILRGTEWVMDFLFEQGVDLNAGGVKKSINPLVVAIEVGNKGALDRLLEAGTSIDIDNSDYNNIVDAVAGIGHEGIAEIVLDQYATINITEKMLVRAATREDSSCESIMGLLLSRKGNLQITDAVVVAGVMNPTFSNEIIGLLFANDAHLEITEPVLELAADKHHNHKMMNLLLTRSQKTELSESLVVKIAGEFDVTILELVLERGGKIQLSEPVIVAAVNNWRCGKEVIDSLLSKDTSIGITEGIMLAAVRNERHGVDIVELLLGRGTGIKITEAIIITAMGNERYREDIMKLVLARGVEIEITEAVIVAAAGNEHGAEMVELLLGWGTGIKITEAIILAAMRNERHGEDIIKLVLARGAEIEITEAVIVAAARNPPYSVLRSRPAGELGDAEKSRRIEILGLLLARCVGIRNTEAIILAAVRNWDQGNRVMELLLARGVETDITEKVIVEAVNHQGAGKHIIQMLLEQDAEIDITEAIIVAAMQSWNKGNDTIKLLLARGAGIKITEAVIVAAMENGAHGEEMIKLLLAPGAEIKITEAVIVAATRDASRRRLRTEPHVGLVILELLLAQGAEMDIATVILAGSRDHDIGGVLQVFLSQGRTFRVTQELVLQWVQMLPESLIKTLLESDGVFIITDEVVIAMAKKHWSPDNALSVLHRAGTINISEESMIEAVKEWNGAVMELLLPIDPSTQLMEALLLATAQNSRSSKEVMELLLARDNNLEINEAVLANAVRCFHDNTEIIEFLLATNVNLEITESILLAAVSNYGWKAILELLMAKGMDIEITEKIMVAVAESTTGVETLKALFTIDPNIPITRKVIRAAAQGAVCVRILELILTINPSPETRAEVLQQAVTSSSDCEKMIRVLLVGDRNIEITEELMAGMCGSTRHRSWGDMVAMGILLDSDANITITEAALVVAARTLEPDVFNSLLARANTVKINERTLVAAAENESGSYEILRLLLSNDPSAEVTEAVLAAAVRNCDRGKVTTELLLYRNPDVEVTEAILVAAASNPGSGKEVLKLLLSKYPGIEITEELILGATESFNHRAGIMEVLLATGPNTKATEAVVAAAARRGTGKRTLEILLDRNPNIQINEALLIEAARNPNIDTDIMPFLLARGPDIEITEAVLAAAAGSHGNGTSILYFLFAGDPDIKITEAAVVAAAGNYSNGTGILSFLFSRDPDIVITEAAVVAAIGGDSNDTEILSSLFARDPDIEITEAIVLAAMRNPLGAKKIMGVLAGAGRIEITEAILTASKRIMEGEEIMDLLRVNNIRNQTKPTAPKKPQRNQAPRSGVLLPCPPHSQDVSIRASNTTVLEQPDNPQETLHIGSDPANGLEDDQVSLNIQPRDGDTYTS